MSKIVGIGACVADTLVTLPCYPAENTKMRVSDIKQNGGGPAATGIVAAVKLGVPSAFFGNLSDDGNGQFLMSDFEKYGVDTAGIKVLRGFRSFTSNIWLSQKSGTRTCVFDKGDLPPFELTCAHKNTLKKAHILMVDGNDLEAAVSAARIAKASGAAVLYDAGGLYEGVERLLELTDILIPSEEFALGYTGAADVKTSARILNKKYNPKALVITQGKRGGLLFENGSLARYPAFTVEVIDSNGAGDVFHGAFAAGLVKGYNLIQCCHYASAVSAIKCTGFGARESVPAHITAIEFLRRNGYEF